MPFHKTRTTRFPLKPLFGVLTLLWLAPAEAIDHARMLREKLAYLNELPDIEWVEFEQNSVYIGWKRLPEDFIEINHQAALKGNAAIDFGAHVWSVPAKSTRWRPGHGAYYCETTARKGKIHHSSCEERTRHLLGTQGLTIP